LDGTRLRLGPVRIGRRARASATLCAADTFSATGDSASCAPAAPGTYVASTAATATSVCAPGTFQSLLAQTSCNAAPAGSFVAGAGAMNATLCAPGTYQPLVGQTACLSAQPGFYVATTGATTQTQCGVGTTSLSGATSCSSVGSVFINVIRQPTPQAIRDLVQGVLRLLLPRR
jgi:hypothetical protein